MGVFSHRGDFKKTEKFLKQMKEQTYLNIIDNIAQRGVAALSSATPQDTGLASESWGYEVEVGKSKTTIVWTNSDVENGFPVAIMLQYGHGTGTGGYVQGIDYINPAIKPIFDQIADAVWDEVRKA